MYKLTFICVALLAIVATADVAPADFNDSIEPRIQGAVTSRRHEFPHLCAIEVIRTFGSNGFIGAGNVLNRRWILTVATGLTPNTINRRTEVVCGRFDLSLPSEPTEQRMRIGAIHRHPQFVQNAAVSANDIALVQLTAELHFTVAVQAITLPQATTTPTGIASLIGWGGSDDVWIGQRLQRLQMTRVAILPTVQCTAYLAQWRLRSNATHFCTGPTTGGLSPCDEDRGSTLLQQTTAGLRVAIGLVSLPQGCGAPTRLGTYTRVSQFVVWINQVLLANNA